MNIKPILDRIVVLKDTQEQISKGGIILPSKHEQPVEQGTVIAVGPGHVLKNGQIRPLQVKPGDRVIFTSRWYMDFEDGTDRYLMMNEEDVIAVIEDEAVELKEAI